MVILPNVQAIKATALIFGRTPATSSTSTTSTTESTVADENEEVKMNCNFQCMVKVIDD